MRTIARNATLVGALSLAGVGATVIGDEALDGSDGTAAAQVAAVPSAFVPIDSYRALDTRDDAVPGRLVASESVVVTADEDSEGNQVIPDEATAVTFNITVAGTRGSGFVQVTTANRELGNTSTINWRGDDEVIANSGVTSVFESTFAANEALENTFSVFIDGSADASAHVVVDITGYFAPLPS